MKVTNSKMIDAIDEMLEDLPGKTISWGDIRERIASQFDLPENFNWLRARGALQVFIGDGSLTRTDDLRVEVYAVGED
jgi:hypothetical protein